MLNNHVILQNILVYFLVVYNSFIFVNYNLFNGMLERNILFKGSCAMFY